MTATVTDLFCGAGGSSLGAETAGLQLVMAANHWQTAIDVHQANFPDAAHDCADISQADPRRYPRTDILLASPECTNHSQARGISRRRQDPTLWDAPDPAAERSRATMWDVGRFAEQLTYDCLVVENVVDAVRWVGWNSWLQYLTDQGYEHRVLSHNSMHHDVPQSRDRIYVVFWRKGLKPDLELELTAWCPRCDLHRTVRQGWKNGRRVGRYRQQWVWACTTCDPSARPAAEIIDWSLPCPRIGDRGVTPCPECGRHPCGRHWKPLADATRARILAGLQRYGWSPVVTSGAGNGFERTPGNRARPVFAGPMPAQTCSASQALAMPPGFLFQTAHGGRTHDLMQPHPTVCASDDRLAFVAPLRSGRPRTQRVNEPFATVVAEGSNHALVVRSYGFEGSGSLGRFVSTTDNPMPTLVTTQRPALLVTNRRHHTPQPVDEPLTTLCAGGQHQGLVMRHNGGGAEMVTPLDEPARTMTTRGHQSLIVPYYGHGQAQPADRPLPTVRTRDGAALIDPEQIVDDCGFRMLESHEIAAAMAFPPGYIPDELTKKDRVRLAGNAVTPPVMTWITGRLLQALQEAG